MSTPAAPRQRIDRWLFFARLVKSRTLAAKIVAAGKVRVNKLKIDLPARTVGPGDTLTISLNSRVRVIRILDTGSRRGPSSEAQSLYEDLSPPVPQPDRAASLTPLRDRGSGRPTKKQRRELEKWKGRSDHE